ncbi:ion channel protein [Microbacterium mangrovi]|uniref:Ion channel protein n=1 Tax=Microbacterium mangrovi TaxID=1348253 RepID=A0A0B2A6P4_9MICO|nr:ion channel protein [Microbacterium mangrovi]KHK97218.1 ion channel protein [Microbacterium mangrovi]
MSDVKPARASVRTLVAGAVPALLIGIGSAVTLRIIDLLSDQVNALWWTTLPHLFGATNTTPWWIFTVLTITGALIGLVVWLVPGHGGFDSAVTELDGPFPKLTALPSLALVLVLSLAGGVSLGPENPIIAINAALAIALISRLTTRMPAPLLALLALSGTLGALFGTPVAAALLFTGVVAGTNLPGSLWDKLFFPLVAAAAGSITMLMLGGNILAFKMADTGPFQPIWLLTGFVVAAAAAVIAIAMAWVFPFVHRVFHSLRNPFLFTLLGGAILGVLGMLGGPITLFKGADQTIELLQHPSDYSITQLASFAGIKILALLVAASAGFRGGRIFPAVFIGAALGLLAASLIPGMPVALAVASSLMGVMLVVGRDGWLAIFVAVALTGDVNLLTVLCVIIIPVWLIVTKAPEMVVKVKNPAKEFA